MLNACEPCVYIHDEPPCAPPTRVSTPAYVSLARVRVSTRLCLGKTTDAAVFVRLRMRVTATKYAYPPHTYVVGIMTKRMLHIIFYTKRVKSVRAYISVVRAYICDGHGLMTTVEFPCNPLRALSPHDTYRGWNSDAHAIMLPRRRHVGYVHHVMLTQELSSFISSAIS